MNKLTGEREIDYNGERITLRPDFSALMDIESTTKKSVIKLLSDFSDPEGMKISEAIIICWCCAKSAGHYISLKEFGETLVKTDVTEIITLSVEMLSYVMGGGEKKREHE